MFRRLFPLWILLIIMGVFGLQTAHYFPLLPDRIATHFGLHGIADGWSSKTEFVTTFAMTLTGMWAFLCGVTLAMKRTPDDMINLPHKEYWLAPERRDATLAYVREHMLWMAFGAEIFLLVVAESIFRANLLPSPRLSGIFGPLTAAFLVYLAVWIYTLTRRFSVRPE